MGGYGKIIIYGLLLVLGAVLIYSQAAKSQRCTEEAAGTIVGFRRSKYSAGRYRRHRKYPVVEYVVDEQTIQEMADVRSLRYKEGSVLEIRYNRDKPEEFVVKTRSFVSSMLSGGLLVLLGAAGLILNFVK